jgi:hypothetical protein
VVGLAKHCCSSVFQVVRTNSYLLIASNGIDRFPRRQAAVRAFSPRSIFLSLLLGFLDVARSKGKQDRVSMQVVGFAQRCNHGSVFRLVPTPPNVSRAMA